MIVKLRTDSSSNFKVSFLTEKFVTIHFLPMISACKLIVNMKNCRGSEPDSPRLDVAGLSQMSESSNLPSTLASIFIIPTARGSFQLRLEKLWSSSKSG